jgi:hypothetical protein
MGRGLRLKTVRQILTSFCKRRTQPTMYQSPELKKLGTFREVTQSGVSGPQDRIGVFNDGCTFTRPFPGRCS